MMLERRSTNTIRWLFITKEDCYNTFLTNIGLFPYQSKSLSPLIFSKSFRNWFDITPVAGTRKARKFLTGLFLWFGGPGAGAPCVFQRLRQVGQGLDGELAQLVPRAGLTSAQTDAVIPAGAPLPSGSRSLKAEFRASARTPDRHGFFALSAKKGYL